MLDRGCRSDQLSTAYCEAFVRLVHAQALDARGERGEAARVIAAARDRLLQRAANIDDAPLRRSFLENVPENARTLELAARWLD
jgi:hypothetical protein